MTSNKEVCYTITLASIKSLCYHYNDFTWERDHLYGKWKVEGGLIYYNYHDHDPDLWEIDDAIAQLAYQQYLTRLITDD